MHERLTSETEILVRFVHAQWFSKYKVTWKTEMYRMIPNWNWTHNSQKYPVHTKFYCFRGPSLGPVYPTTSRFRDTMASKIGNAPNEPKLLNLYRLNIQKYLVYTNMTYPRVQMLVRFPVRPLVS